MGMKWSTLLLLLVIQCSNIRCEDGQAAAADDSIKDVQTSSSLPIADANDGSSNRRRPQTDPEHEHSGIEKASSGLYFDTADWSKEAEKWMFKGGDWGLVTLPDDSHPDIADPPVPGPALIAEGNSMKKVIVSRSLSGLENVSLHFSYFLTNNPKNSPQLQVFQLQGNINSLVWPNDEQMGYGQWNYGRVDMLPISGDFEIKFIGQRVVDTNDIGLDDIVVRGTYIKNTVGDGILRAVDSANHMTSLIPLTENNIETNETRAEITTVSNENDKINATENEDEVSNNSSMVTENPQDTNYTGTNVPDNDYNQSYTSAPENFSSIEAHNNATNNVINTTAPSDKSSSLDTIANTTVHLSNRTSVPSDQSTTLDTAQNTTDHVVNITSQAVDNLTKSSKISTDTSSFNNTTVVDNTTDIIQNISSTHLNQNITSPSLSFNATTLQPQNQTAPIQNVTNSSFNTTTLQSQNQTAPIQNVTNPSFSTTTLQPQNQTASIQNVTNPSFNITTLQPQNQTAPIQNVTDPSFNTTTLQPQNQTAPIQNVTNPSLNISTPLFNFTTNASIFVTGLPGGIGGTDSPPVEDTSWGVFKIFLTITVLGGIVLIYLYWRQRHRQDDEIPVFSRGSHADYHNPTFQDDASADEGLAGRGSPFNYKSFS